MDIMCYACLYNDYETSLAAFTDEEFGRLTRAMIRYNTTGETPEFTGNERFIWPMLQAQMDRDRKAYTERCENNRRNGKKGGRPKKEPAEKTDMNTETDGKTDRLISEPKKPNKKKNDKENEKKNEKKNDKEKNNDKDKKADTEDRRERGHTNVCADSPYAAQPPQAPFIPPTVEEVRAYCQTKGYDLDPESFVDYYESIGWMRGNRYIRKWKAALARWNALEYRYS